MYYLGLHILEDPCVFEYDGTPEGFSCHNKFGVSGCAPVWEAMVVVFYCTCNDPHDGVENLQVMCRSCVSRLMSSIMPESRQGPMKRSCRVFALAPHIVPPNL